MAMTGFGGLDGLRYSCFWELVDAGVMLAFRISMAEM